jgi:hypothetical protein
MAGAPWTLRAADPNDVNVRLLLEEQQRLYVHVAFRDAARSVAGRPGAHRFHDFLICNGPYRHDIVPLGLRSLGAEIMLSR